MLPWNQKKGILEDSSAIFVVSSLFGAELLSGAMLPRKTAHQQSAACGKHKTSYQTPHMPSLNCVCGCLDTGVELSRIPAACIPDGRGKLIIPADFLQNSG